MSAPFSSPSSMNASKFFASSLDALLRDVRNRAADSAVARVPEELATSAADADAEADEAEGPAAALPFVRLASEALTSGDGLENTSRANAVADCAVLAGNEVLDIDISPALSLAGVACDAGALPFCEFGLIPIRA